METSESDSDVSMAVLCETETIISKDEIRTNIPTRND